MLGVAASSLVGTTMLGFSISMAHIFYKSKRKTWQVVLCWLVYILISVPLGGILHPVFGNSSGQYTGFLALFVYLYLFDIPLLQRFFTYFFVDTCMYTTALVSRYSALLLKELCPGLDDRGGFAILYFILTFAFVAVFLCRLRRPMTQRLSQFESRMGSMTVFALLGYVVLLLLFDAWQIRYGITGWEYVSMWGFILLLGYGYYVAFFSLEAAHAKAEAQERIRELTGRMEHAERYYTALTDHIQEIRRIQHDTRHHLRVLDGYARDRAYEQIREYISAMIEQGKPLGNILYCANYTANILIDFYAEQAAGEHTSFYCDAQITADIGCPPQHLSILLGNVLQNALEACARQKDTQVRSINLFARVVDHNLILNMENTYDGVVEETDGRICSVKEEQGHGIGLDSVKNTVQLYNGYFSASYTESLFKINIVLPLQQGMEPEAPV